MVSRVITAVRERSPGIAAVALHNDFRHQRLQPNCSPRGEATPGSYLEFEPPVVPLALAASFFKRQPRSAPSGWAPSCSAAHWLLKGFYFCEAEGGTRAALAGEATRDWTTFLRARSADLAPGGRLLVQMVGTSHAGDLTARRLLPAMAKVGDDLTSEGLLDRGAVDRHLLPV